MPFVTHYLEVVMSLMDMLQQRLGGDTVNRISNQIGADPGTTNSAIMAALPLLVSAMARNTADQGKAQSLSNAVSQDHDGSILDDVPGYLDRQDTSAGKGILKHVLGSRQTAAQSGLSQVTGMDQAKVGQLLTVLAPLVMGALGKSQRERGLDGRGLATLLTSEQESLKQSSPGVMGGLNRFLDQDGDGSVLDDVGGMLGKAFGGKR